MNILNSRLDRSEYIENNELWLRMLNDDKLAAEGYHELMENFNIEFIKKSGEGEICGDTNNTGLGKNQIGCITRTPLLIAAVKAVDLARGHQVYNSYLNMKYWSFNYIYDSNLVYALIF